MHESAAPDDRRYLLQGLDHTPLRFRLKSLKQAPKDSPESEIVGYVQDHTPATVNDIQSNIPALQGRSYNDTRTMVVRLVDAGILEAESIAPLEEVDPRYERVATCDVCGSPSAGHKIVLWKYNTPVVRCSTCGLLYANPRWKAEHLFGRYTDEYWDQYAGKVQEAVLDAAANQARYDPYLDVLEGVRKNNRLLDIGCATGEFLIAARARGWDVYGVETSPIAAAQAERALGADGRIHTGTLPSKNHPEGWFDAVTLWDVIEHLQSPRSYIEQIRRLLRPGGMFAISTPNIKSVAYLLMGRRWWVVGPNDHIYYFAPRTLTRLLKDCGFAVHNMHTINSGVDTLYPYHPGLRRLAPLINAVILPISNKYMLGDAIVAFARRLEG